MSHDKYDHDERDCEKAISIELPRVDKGEKTTVRYNGILTNNGADKVYLHYGFDNWNDAHTIPMSRTNHSTYTTEVKINGRDEMNFCFKDSAGNWDNNNGSNWNVNIRS